MSNESCNEDASEITILAETKTHHLLKPQLTNPNIRVSLRPTPTTLDKRPSEPHQPRPKSATGLSQYQ
jgi:hypothetical protein